MTNGHLDEEILMALTQRGILLNLSRNAGASFLVLWDHIWKQLQSDRQLWSQLMKRRYIGPWLLRSRAELGHSLMNTGQWEQASFFLEETIEWIHEHEAWLRQQMWEEEVRIQGVSLNLRWTDTLVKSQQFLGIVLQPSDYERAQGHLQTILLRLLYPCAASAVDSGVFCISPRNEYTVSGGYAKTP